MQEPPTLFAAKFKLYPTAKQRKALEQNIHASRYVYNWGLSLMQEHYNKYRNDNKIDPKLKYLNYNDLANQLVVLKTQQPWLTTAYSQVLQQSLMILNKAMLSYTRDLKRGIRHGHPKFKSVKNPKQSVFYPQQVKINDKCTKVHIPGLPKGSRWVKIRGYNQQLGTNIKRLSITFHSTGAISGSLIVELDRSENQAAPKNDSLKIVGIDVGTRKFLTDSNGNMVKPYNYKQEITKLAKLQAMLAKSTKHTIEITTATGKVLKKKVYSNNGNRIKARIAKQHKRIANIRNNYIHHIANMYRDYDIVCVEKLDIQAMVKNTAGTVDNPNNDSKRKSNLNHVVNNQGWYMFYTILEYKLKHRGHQLIKVAPEYTSQRCNVCGDIDKNSRHGENYKCTKCGYTNDADVNAARNIKDIGIGVATIAA